MVPTTDSRLEILEHKVDELLTLINSGPNVPWEQSIRGKLHRVTNTLDNADKLAEALREVRRERSQRWTRGERFAALLFAAATLATPYVLLLVH